MHFEQYYLACLSHASYLVGSEGVAALVDPRRDVNFYLEEARARDLVIRYVIETHLHADFVSGHRELAALTGATIYMGAAAKAAFPHVAVRDGDQLAFGRCRLQFLETPGHSPDSISILVTDLDRAAEPFAVLTGDTLFIGDVGRPDLSMDSDAAEMAAQLYRTLHGKLLKLPDDVEVYPAHGAGSLCGKQLSSETRSTIGRERRANYALRPMGEADFIRLITSELPEKPGYFFHDKEINRAGAAALSELPPPRAMPAWEVAAAQQNGVIVLDTRPASGFAHAHIPRSIHIGLAGQFAAWAGDLLGLRATLILVAEDANRLAEARLRLARVGIENVAGYLEGGIGGWVRAGLPIAQTPEVPVTALHELLAARPAEVQVIDVRRGQEHAEAAIPGSLHIPLHDLEARATELRPKQSMALYCKSGYRSMIGASLLERAGLPAVSNLTGGMDAWRTCGLPVVRAET